MDGWRHSLLHLADNLVCSTATAGITFGFLADGREIVDIVSGAGVRTADFSDHADEGWPGFHLRLPDGVAFQGAFFSVLGRRAHFIASRPAERIVEELGRLNDLDFAPAVDGINHWNATRDDGVEVAVQGTDRGCGLAVRQFRDADAIGEALRNRVLRFREELDASWSGASPQPAEASHDPTQDPGGPPNERRGPAEEPPGTGWDEGD
jgi:hypothetical protein